MRISDALSYATASARRVKEDHVRHVRGKAGRTDIATMIECYRGDVPVAVVFLPPDRDAMLNAAWLAAGGFSADVMAVTMETWQSGGLIRGFDNPLGEELALHPITGKPFERDDLGDLAANHQGIERGWVVEALMTHVLNRAGDEAHAPQPYALHGRVVEWLELHPQAQGQLPWERHFEGVVPDALRDAMKAPDLEQLIFKEARATYDNLGYGMERGRAHADVATFRAITSKVPEVFALLLQAKPGSVREQILRERLPRSAIQRPPV